MTKRKRSKAESPRDRDRKRLFWRTVCVMAFVLLLVLLGYYAAVNRRATEDAAAGDHFHQPAAHHGIIVSLGDDDHHHVEVVLERGGVLKLYTLGGDVLRVVEVESQIMTAQVRQEGTVVTAVLNLMPMPQPCDSQGKTSQFMGSLPRELWKKKLVVTVPSITFAGRQYAFEFQTTGLAPDGNVMANGQDRERLFLTPGGKYTEADIQANGNQTAWQRFQGFQTSHDAQPQFGDKICPVSRTKADPRCTWVVGGKVYAFCCPPCISEFLRRAQKLPQAVKEPEEYVKK